MKSAVRTRLLASTLLVGSVALANPAFAQDSVQPAATTAPATGMTQPQEAAVDDPTSPTENGDIVVTGSLIRNPNLIASAPVNVIGEAEIELRQANVAEELLRELPGAVPSIGSAVNNGNNGASYVDLRGLGSFRNVVLLDGVRIVPSGLAGRVDLNNIPLALVQRVDVLTGGASTTYGADAISGVVNFVTKQDFAGVDVNASEQITQRGDGNVLRFDATIGANFDDGRGNAVFSVGYQESDPVYQGSRSFSNFSVDPFTGASGGSGTAVPSRFSLGALGTRQINDAGTAFLPSTAFTAFNFNPYNIFQTPFERFNMYGAAKYEITDGVEVYSRGLFSKQTVSTIIAPSGAFAISVQVPISNPFLTASQRSSFCLNADSNAAVAGVQTLTQAQCDLAATATGPTDPNYRAVTTQLSRRAVEFGPRVSDYTTQVFDYRLGLRGAINSHLNYDVFGSYGESRNDQLIQGYYLNSRVRQSLLTVRNANGSFSCQDASNGCIPANFFGAQGTITPEMSNFLTANSTVAIQTSLAQARGTVSGDFGVTSPFASEPVSFAVGGEYRSYTASQQSDLLASSGDLGGAGGASPNINGSYDVYEAIGELIVPLVEDRPLFHSLTAEGGIRYSHYTINAAGRPTFNTTTYKGGGSWEPVEGLKFRGNYAHAVRAPNIGELFSPQNTGLTNLSDDPCANRTNTGAAIAGRATPTGVLRDVCIAQGAPAFTIGQIAVPTSGQANATGGGNLLLQPEKSNSYTFGAVFNPRSFLPGFNGSIDYYHIKVTGAVSTPTPGDAINACFNNLSVTNPDCLSIRRNPLDGSLSGDPATTRGLFLASSNLGVLLTDGIDLSLNYSTDIGFGKLAFGFTGNWTNRSTFQATATSINRDCVGIYSVNCGSIQPEFQWSQRTTLTVDQIDLSLLWRHIDGVDYEFASTAPALSGTVALLGGGTYNFNRIKAYDYFDLATRISVMDNVTLTITVQNLLDKQPPVVGGTIGPTSFNSGNTYPSTYDALGRRYAIGARLKF